MRVHRTQRVFLRLREALPNAFPSRLTLNSMTGESWARSKRYGCHEEALESYCRRPFEEENGYPQTSWSPEGAKSRRTECGRVEGPTVLPLSPTAALYLPGGSGAFVVGLEVSAASHLCSGSDGGQTSCLAWIFECVGSLTSRFPSLRVQCVTYITKASCALPQTSTGLKRWLR